MLLALTVTTAAAEPDYADANNMLPYCKDYLSGSNTLDVGFCAGVVEEIGYMAPILERSSSLVWGHPYAFRRESPAAKVRAVTSYIEVRSKRMDEPSHHVSCQCPVRPSRDQNGQKRRMQVTSEGPTKITKATIEAAWRRRKKDHRLIVRDAECRGLALVVNPTTMRWEYAYRPRGTDPLARRRWPNRTVTLGNPETHSPEDARIAANRIKSEAKARADPTAEKKARAVVQQRQRAARLGRSR